MVNIEILCDNLIYLNEMLKTKELVYANIKIVNKHLKTFYS